MIIVYHEYLHFSDVLVMDHLSSGVRLAMETVIRFFHYFSFLTFL